MDFDLVRRLIKKRFAACESAEGLGLEEELASAPESMIAGAPEATIFALVETWHLMSQGGASSTDIFRAIEGYRSPELGGREGPPPTDLIPYVLYRLAIEHPEAPGLSVDHVMDCIDVVLDHLSRPTRTDAQPPPPEPAEPSLEELTAFANAPDMRGKRPFAQYNLGRFIVVLFEDLDTHGAAYGIPTLVKYLYVAAVFDNPFAAPVFWVALETGPTSHAFLCVGDPKGSRDNCGRHDELRSKEDFSRVALKLVGERLGVTEKPVAFELSSQGAKKQEAQDTPVPEQDSAIITLLVVAMGIVVIVVLVFFSN